MKTLMKKIEGCKKARYWNMAFFRRNPADSVNPSPSEGPSFKQEPIDGTSSRPASENQLWQTRRWHREHAEPAAAANKPASAIVGASAVQDPARPAIHEPSNPAVRPGADFVQVTGEQT